jgi:hypothetical protein
VRQKARLIASRRKINPTVEEVYEVSQCLYNVDTNLILRFGTLKKHYDFSLAIRFQMAQG